MTTSWLRGYLRICPAHRTTGRFVVRRHGRHAIARAVHPAASMQN
ncbi:hypothetical protein [Mycolicibacterium thermoresistibile]|uniref:Uncharacterized protein n=1 Tax=Mycolicibacterium thermoresistibile (strain ATCC 19527 / DSM 44167 / CIP 105390 / JCM 6362 / NCTC 10409 / 316) TaxID=1078020 RepID=G7CJF6_MYCT3|nr:hypothetical protein [Mycolicibacterium thermoresistibile]EHI12754.1 hypothetical protein KEK_17683 [Mycolicibacterium thermoresistibile ATCC 19527]